MRVAQDSKHHTVNMGMDLDGWIVRVKGGDHLPEWDLKQLCDYVKELLIEESNVQVRRNRLPKSQCRARAPRIVQSHCASPTPSPCGLCAMHTNTYAFCIECPPFCDLYRPRCGTCVANLKSCHSKR